MINNNKYLTYLNTAKGIIAPLSENHLKSAETATNEINDMITRIEEKPEPIIAFVGTYSSGKSTIIKRLTGVEIATGINPLTSEISGDILWQGFRIVDTPGLKSNQYEHDQKTLSFIGKADIVVWIIEADRLLLDEHKIAFTKIAVDLLKADRILLVVNQMDLTGVNILDKDEWERIKDVKSNEIYRILNEINISISYPISFVAADPDQVGDGLTIEKAKTEWNKSPYAEKSHFYEFEDLFNTLLKKEGAKSTFEGAVDRAFEHLGLVKDDLSKIKTTFEKTNELANIKLNGLKEINKKASLRYGTMKANCRNDLNKLFNSELKNHINSIAKPEDFNKLQILLDENKINALIDKFVNESFESFINSYDKYIVDLYVKEENRINGLYLNKEVEQCLDEILKLFRERPSNDYGVFKDVNFRVEKENFILENKDELSKFIKQGLGCLPKEKEAYRNIVYNIGKKMGKKFKPYEALKLGEKVSKVIEALPAVLAALEIVIDIVKFINAGKHVEKIENKKMEILQSINTIEQEVWTAIENELTEYYDSISLPLNEEITKESSSIDNNRKQIKLYEILSTKIEELQSLRKSL